MVFKCDKCEKTFQREEHLNRHLNRKIPCDREIKCPRCGIDFIQISDLKRHLNKKNKCQDMRELLHLQIKLEETKNKGKSIDKEIEETKLKQSIAEKPNIQIAGRDINNTTNTHNIINVFCAIEYTKDEADDMTISGDVNASLSNFVKLHFNNDEFPMNRCIKLINDKIFINVNNKMVSFEIARKYFNEKVINQIELVINKFRKYSDEYMDQFGLNQKNEYLSDAKIDTLEKIDPYIKNNRYKGDVKNAVITAII